MLLNNNKIIYQFFIHQKLPIIISHPNGIFDFNIIASSFSSLSRIKIYFNPSGKFVNEMFNLENYKHSI